jgi:RNA polymerase sigma factor (sigma-70 family)
MNPSDSALQDMPDETLVRQVRAGNEVALTVLYRRHVAAIYRFVLAQVRDVQDAEDLTADTFARMLRGLEGFRGEASFRNWLYQIARNAVRNHRRSAGYRLNVPLANSLEASAAADTDGAPCASDDSSSADEVLALLQPLPPRYRQILELRFLAGRSIDDVATQMGISVANAKVLQHRALKKAALVMAPTEARFGTPSTGS